MLSGDIEINPGPVNEPMYPCAVCQLGVNWSHQAVACDVCDVWVHKSCASMDSTTYADMRIANGSVTDAIPQTLAHFCITLLM